MWKLEFDYTDIVKCDGEFFLKSTRLDFDTKMKISTINNQILLWMASNNLESSRDSFCSPTKSSE
jgi:hypothetical protein